MKKFTKIAWIAMLLLVMPMKQFAQERNQIRDYEGGFLFNMFEIETVEERIQLASALATSDIWICNPTDNPGELFIRPNGYNKDIPIYAEFDYLRMTLKEEYGEVSALPKEEFAEIFNSWAQNISIDYYNFLISDQVGDRANHCMDAEPFCTSDVYNFPAINSGYSWSGPNYGCLGSSPTMKHSFWYYMRIGQAGNITIKIEASFDVDFAMWGPFNDQTAPCPTQAGQAGLLTANCSNCPNNTLSPNFYPSGNLHDCSFDAAHYEYAHVVNGQVGQYYILLITNYSGSSGNITFQKYAGNGETDCGIMPPLVSSDSPLCVGETLHLTANGQAGASYSWTGPGGWTSTTQNPTRPNCSMAMAGTYTCTISVGSQTNSATTDVVVVPQPTANFTAAPVCKGMPTQFTSTSTTNPPGQNIISYNWNFGDGTTGTGASINHTYSSAGNYQAKLTVSTGSRCTSEKTQTVTVYDMPKANAGPDQSINYGATATLSGSGGTGSFSYHWEPANKVVNPNAQTTQTVALTQTTHFTLTVTSVTGGCTNTDQVTVAISGTGMTASANADNTVLCQGESTTLHANPVGGSGNYTYSWTPTTGLNNPTAQHPVATPPMGNTTYTCHVDDNGLTSQDVSVSIMVHPNKETPVYASFCDNTTYPFFGQEINEAGTYQHILETQYGCDSTIILHLTKNPTYLIPVEDVFCDGNSYEWFGQSYNQSGTYEHVLPTIQGCDSVIQLTLNQLPVSHSNITASICPGGSYPFFGNLLTEAGNYTGTAVNQWGCDSIVELTLAINDHYETDFTINLCDGSYNWAGTNFGPLTENGDYNFTFESQAGCDSIVTLHLAFHPVQDGEYTMTACDSYTWSAPLGNDQTYTESGVYSTQKTTEWGCDYENHLNLTINKSVQTNLNLSECDEYVWNGNNAYNSFSDTIKFSGLHSHTFRTMHDCDSVVNIQMDMEYTPTYERIDGNRWPLGGSLTHISIEEYQIKGFHQLAQFDTQWELGCPDWTFETYGDHNACCKIVITTFPVDSILLKATTTNRCGTFYDSIWIRCTYYDVEEYEDLCNVDIVPNPNNGDMTFNFSNMLGKVEVCVYNMTGNLIDRFKTHNELNSTTMSYSMRQCAPGMYYFVITNKDKSITKKVVIL